MSYCQFTFLTATDGFTEFYNKLKKVFRNRVQINLLKRQNKKLKMICFLILQ